MSVATTHVFDRFEGKYLVNAATGCWDWTASKNLGYGQIGAGGRGNGPLFAHRVSYEKHKGTIPPALVVDHVCRNRGCVNPDHLRLLTRGENVMCGETIPARHAAKDRCDNGHIYAEVGYYTTKLWHRQCRECKRLVGTAHYQRLKARK